MKISIITVCFNSAATIEDTIKSVVAQDCADLEYIIIDGGSVDGTLEIIGKYKDKISKVVSEPDQGIYDAMNKGIRLATGEIVGILNADDYYWNGQVLSQILIQFERENIDACYGDLVYVKRTNTNIIVRYWKAGWYNKKKLENGWIIPHPTFFVKKDVYNKFGLFDLNFKIAADYELMLRFLKKNIKLSYINRPLICMREGGYSAKNIRQRLIGWRELKIAWKKNGQEVPLFFILRRTLSKIHQYFI